MSTTTSKSTAFLLASLVLASAFGTIGGSVGLNALVKSNQQKSFLRHSAPPGTRVVINTDDVLESGIVIAVVCACIGAVAFVSQVLLLQRPALEASTRKSRGLLLGFFTIWLLPTQIAFTYFFAMRSAVVKAFLNGQQLPDSLVRAQEKHLGTTRVYKEIGYLRLLAVLPWIAFLFGAISTIALLTIPSDTKSEAYGGYSPSSTEKAQMSEHETSNKQ